MKILALDSSSRTTGLALYQWKENPHQGETLACRIIENDRQHAENILSQMDQLLKEEGTSLEDLSGFACSLGPGSFTGIRIGVTTAKSLAQFSHKSVWGVSTLLALAASLPKTGQPDHYVVPLMDARGKRVFAALMQEEAGDLSPVMGEGLFFEADFIRRLSAFKESHPQAYFHFIGRGLDAHSAILRAFSGQSDRFEGEEADSPVKAVARLAAIRCSRGEADSFLDLRPNYLRKSQAEIDHPQAACPPEDSPEPEAGEKQEGGGRCTF